MRKKSKGEIKKENLSELFLDVIAIKSGDFGEEGIIMRDEIEKCSEKLTGLPVFYSHQRTDDDYLGEVVSSYMKNDQILAKIKLMDETNLQQKVIGHIKRGNITNVSLGFKTCSMKILDNRDLLFDIEPEELSIVAPYPFDEAVCTECQIVERNFSKNSFFSLSDNQILFSHLQTHLQENDSRHETVVDEMMSRDLFH